MEEQYQDAPEVHETQETEAEAVETTETVTLTAEELAELKKKAEVSSQNFERLKKVEEENKRLKEGRTEASSPYTLADQIAIANAKVHEDDVERLERFAKAEGLSIKDAIKNPEWKAIQALRDEQRATADTANVAPVRRGPSKVTDEALLEKAVKGDIPESESDIERLIAAKTKAERGN